MTGYVSSDDLLAVVAVEFGTGYGDAVLGWIEVGLLQKA